MRSPIGAAVRSAAPVTTRGIRACLAALALPVALVLAWWLWSTGTGSPLLPAPDVVARAGAETWLGGRLVADVLPSLARLTGGYTLGLVAGIATGVVIGSSPGVRVLLEPALEFLRAIPPPVLVPVLVLLAGIGDLMKVLVIAFGCVWPVLLNTVEGVRGGDAVLRDTARCYGLRTPARVRFLVLPAAGPQIAAGARQALSIGLALMVISEMVAASDGLGFAVVQFQRGFALPEMWSGIALLGLVGVGLALVLRAIEKRALAWYHGPRESHGARG